ncbi:MAG: hypothetical protein ACKPEA_11295, partial [Planctomycetota bacterium]
MPTELVEPVEDVAVPEDVDPLPVATVAVPVLGGSAVFVAALPPIGSLVFDAVVEASDPAGLVVEPPDDVDVPEAAG